MSIIIKGMKMPKNCAECKCTWVDDDYNKVCCFTDVVALSIGRQDNCPLIELPPHGRLIDADRLNIHDVSPAYGFCVMGVTEDDIELAETVIEAEGSEE